MKVFAHSERTHCNTTCTLLQVDNRFSFPFCSVCTHRDLNKADSKSKGLTRSMVDYGGLLTDYSMKGSLRDKGYEQRLIAGTHQTADEHYLLMPRGPVFILVPARLVYAGELPRWCDGTGSAPRRPCLQRLPSPSCLGWASPSREGCWLSRRASEMVSSPREVRHKALMNSGVLLHMYNILFCEEGSVEGREHLWEAMAYFSTVSLTLDPERTGGESRGRP